MAKYERKTEDIYYIVSKYGVECCAATLAEAKQNKKDYIENGYPVRIEKHRVKIESRKPEA